MPHNALAVTLSFCITNSALVLQSWLIKWMRSRSKYFLGSFNSVVQMIMLSTADEFRALSISLRISQRCWRSSPFQRYHFAITAALKLVIMYQFVIDIITEQSGDQSLMYSIRCLWKIFCSSSEILWLFKSTCLRITFTQSFAADFLSLRLVNSLRLLKI